MKDLVGQHFGNYQLIRLLGRGGFAEVYLGQHVRLNMQAAIKVLHAHLADEDIEEFQLEAQIIATLVHPNIVRILDFDVREGTPFLVVDYAPHGTLRQRYSQGTRVPLPEIVTAIMQIANALQFAHDQKLIHRDVKPENMLIGRRNEVVLSDFGIATIAHSTSSMQTQASVGTIPYMAPEQIQAHPRPASDQYALGVVVYEWLCGERPFEGSYAEIFAKHLMTPPPSLCEKVPTIPSDVEQVVLTALAKDPKQRFGSVQAFATALEQASRSDQVQKISFAQQITVLSPLAQSLAPTVLATPDAKPLPPVPAVVQEPRLGGVTGSVNTPDQPYPFPLPAREDRQIAPIAPVFMPSKGTLLSTYRGHSAPIRTLAWSPDGKRIASGSKHMIVQIWDPASGQQILFYRGHASSISTVAWSPDDIHIASGSSDGTVRVWVSTTGETIVTYHGHANSSVNTVAYSPDGQRIASGGTDWTVQVWNAIIGQQFVRYRGHSGSIYALAWSPDGTRIVSASRDQGVQIWNVTDGTRILSYNGHSGRLWTWVNSVVWSPDGEYIASGDMNGTVQLWKTTSGDRVATHQDHSAPVFAVAWSPDGTYLASASGDSTVHIREAAAGISILTHHHSAPVYAVAWSPDGKYLASGGADHTIFIWQFQ